MIEVRQFNPLHEAASSCVCVEGSEKSIVAPSFTLPSAWCCELDFMDITPLAFRFGCFVSTARDG